MFRAVNGSSHRKARMVLIGFWGSLPEEEATGVALKNQEHSTRYSAVLK